jgi:hypothetical protein
MTYKRFPSRTHIGTRSGARYAMSDGVQLQVRDDGAWFLNWPAPERRQAKGPDLPSLELWIGRVFEQLKHDAVQAKPNP